jgi:hypothetical protein
MAQSTRGRACLQCGDPDLKPAAKYCSALCRNRFNNALAKTRPVKESEHGTRTGYARGCRCDECRAYNALYSSGRRAQEPKTPRKTRSDKGVKKVSLTLDDHGTTRAYTYFRCRCDACKKAASSYNRIWREANREQYRSALRRYHRQHPDKARSASEARAAAPFDAAALDYAELIERDPCVYCGAKSQSIDHIDPISAGGSSEWGNLAPACTVCNSGKGAKSLLGFMIYRLPG